MQRVGGSSVVRWLALALFTVVGCGSSDGDGRSRDRANPGSTSDYRTGNAGAAGNAGAPGGTGLTGTSYVTGTGGRIGAEVGGSGPVNSGAGGEARLGSTSGEGGNGGQNGSNAGAGGTDQARTVDISEPEAPRIRAGGLLGQDATSLIRMSLPNSTQGEVSLRGNVAVVAGPESKFGGEGERIDVVWLQAGQVQVHATRELAPSETLADTRLLDIDGDKVYAALTERNGNNPVSRVVIGALSLDTLDTVATYDTPQYPSSMTVVDNHLVFGAKTHLLVADPTCASGKP